MQTREERERQTQEENSKEKVRAGQYRDRCVRLYGIMHTEGWQEFLKVIAERKAAIMDKISKTESMIDVASVSQNEKGVTVVLLNKDALQHEYNMLRMLEDSFEQWKIMALEAKEEK